MRCGVRRAVLYDSERTHERNDIYWRSNESRNHIIPGTLLESGWDIIGWNRNLTFTTRMNFASRIVVFKGEDTLFYWVYGAAGVFFLGFGYT